MPDQHTPGPIRIKNSASRIIHQKASDRCLYVVVDGEEQRIGEAYGTAGLPTEANARLWAASPSMEQALRAVLLFHSSSPWDAEKQHLWEEFTGTTEATTKILCDTIRVILESATGSGD